MVVLIETITYEEHKYILSDVGITEKDITGKYFETFNAAFSLMNAAKEIVDEVNRQSNEVEKPNSKSNALGVSASYYDKYNRLRNSFKNYISGNPITDYDKELLKEAFQWIDSTAGRLFVECKGKPFFSMSMLAGRFHDVFYFTLSKNEYTLRTNLNIEEKREDLERIMKMTINEYDDNKKKIEVFNNAGPDFSFPTKTEMEIASMMYRTQDLIFKDVKKIKDEALVVVLAA